MDRILFRNKTTLRKFTRILFLNLLAMATAYGQEFKGTVLDLETKQPVPYASIYFSELHTGTSTNEQGIFTIEHTPVKEIHVQITSIGFESISSVIHLDSGRTGYFYLRPSHIGLDEVIVSAALSRLQSDNIVNVEHRKLEDLQAGSPLNLSEAISNISGVDQSSTGVGIGKPIIRGLSGNRIVTYNQGIRVENQQWGSEHGLGVGQVGIEGVEVIKGPASLLYGSDALGGVVYFIDERYAQHDEMEGFVESRYLSNTIGIMNSAGYKVHKGNLKFNVFGNYNTNVDYKVPEDNRVLNTAFGQKNIKSSLGIDHKNWLLNVRYGYLDNLYGITEEATYTSSTVRGVSLPYQHIKNHALSVENVIFKGKSRVNLTLGLTQNNRKEFEDTLAYPALEMNLSTATYNLKWYSGPVRNRLKVVAGSQGMYQNNRNLGEEVLIPDAQTVDAGLFTLANLELENLQLQGGIRGDFRSIVTPYQVTEEGDVFPALNNQYSSFNFSGGAVYKWKEATIRANVASGFRAPNTSELLSDGVHHGATRYETGNVDLKSERNYQVDLTCSYRNDHFSFALNPFINLVNNFIYLRATGDVVDVFPVYEYTQATSVLYGGEAGVHYHPHAIHWLHLESNLSTVFAQDLNNQPLPLIPAPKISSTAKIEFEKNKGIKNLFVQHTYRTAQNRTGINESPSGDYHLVNAGVNFEWKNITLSTGVKNLLNVSYIDHLSRFKPMGIPNIGRNVFVALKVKFAGKISPEPAV